MSIEKFPNLTPYRAPALACRNRFYLEHVRKSAPSQGFSQPLAYGGAVHETLKGLYDPGIESPTAERDIEGLARIAIYRQGYLDPVGRDADLARCISSVSAYVAQDTDGDATTGVEVFMETVPHPRSGVRPLKLGAKFDRVIVRPEAPDHMVIRDYKTGRPNGIDLDGACLMLAVAKLRYKREGKYRAFSLEYDHLNGHGLVERKTVTTEEAKAVWPGLEERALHVYSATEYPAEPGEHCACCPFRAECQPDLVVDETDLDELFA